MKHLSNLDGYENKTLFQYLVAVICSLIILSPVTMSSALGSETDTNNITKLMISTKEYDWHLRKVPGIDESFWEHLDWQIPIHGERASTIELGYPANFAILQKAYGEDYEFDDMNERGRDIFEDTILRSLRDSFIGWLNLDRFKQDNVPAQLFGAKLIEGTIGGTLEESRRDALSLDPNDVKSTKQWIDSHTRKNRIQYGIKAFDSSPYLRVSAAIGSQYGKKPLMVINTRLHSVISKDGAPRIKTEMLASLGSQTQLSIGASCYPTRFDQEGFQTQFATRLTTEIGKAITYASLGSTRAETLLIGGISVNF